MSIKNQLIKLKQKIKDAQYARMLALKYEFGEENLKRLDYPLGKINDKSITNETKEVNLERNLEEIKRINLQKYK